MLQSQPKELIVTSPEPFLELPGSHLRFRKRLFGRCVLATSRGGARVSEAPHP
jgi:hypothetical protein